MSGGAYVQVRHLVAIAATLLACTSYGCAGAWNQQKGHGQIIFSASLFQTSSEFNPSGAVQPFGDRGQFRQVLLNPYLELGVTRKNTLVVNVNSDLLRFANSYGAASSAGLGDIEIGVKHRLNSVESAWAVGGQLTVMFPAYPASRNPAPGNHQEDVESRFLLGRGRQWGSRHAFWDAEAAYRYRSGAPADEVRADFTTGFDLVRRLMLVAQMFSIKSLRNGAPFATINPNAQSDFDLYKGQASMVANLSRSVRVQAGWNNAFSGRNTGRGNTMLIAMWKSF